ncbi:hypothetical protein E1B28_001957 [Marasmius oreades]|uniref:Uncharacterized protein n=1 Tax=Marasmius oreades TaxID=181124 RepID=A0A9P7V4F5_9AGAR|nr:uncharacterized protein E1B28_001957 [Marasmius oreades]KAG7100180.1 hypothetical protein E1B28_001957 [Marasmius oreades]
MNNAASPLSLLRRFNYKARNPRLPLKPSYPYPPSQSSRRMCSTQYRHPNERHDSSTVSKWVKVGEVTLDLSQTALSTVKELAEFTPIPFLKEAAGCALAIVEAVDRVITNKEEFRLLASHACELVFVAQRATAASERTIQNKDSKMMNNLRHLLNTLSQIKEFADSRATKNPFSRFIHQNSDEQKILAFREMMSHALALFNLQSTIQSHDLLLDIQRNTRYCQIYHSLDVENVPREEATAAERHPSPQPGNTYPETDTLLSPKPQSLPSRPQTAELHSPNPSLLPTPVSTSPNPMNAMFGGNLSGTITGTVTFNNISGDQTNNTDNSKSVRENCGGTYRTQVMNSNNQFYYPYDGTVTR